jgi:hypothetical protein
MLVVVLFWKVGMNERIFREKQTKDRVACPLKPLHGSQKGQEKFRLLSFNRGRGDDINCVFNLLHVGARLLAIACTEVDYP